MVDLWRWPVREVLLYSALSSVSHYDTALHASSSTHVYLSDIQMSSAPYQDDPSVRSARLTTFYWNPTPLSSHAHAGRRQFSLWYINNSVTFSGWLVFRVFTSWQHLRPYQDGYRLVTGYSCGNVIVLSHWETMTWYPTKSNYPETEPTIFVLS